MSVSRLTTALTGLLIGLAVSVAAWIYFETLLFFLFLPFVPLLVPGRNAAKGEADDGETRRCPVCGFETRTPAYEFCPRDGARLSDSGSARTETRASGRDD